VTLSDTFPPDWTASSATCAVAPACQLPGQVLVPFATLPLYEPETSTGVPPDPPEPLEEQAAAPSARAAVKDESLSHRRELEDVRFMRRL
jgi:hypothetical protein